MSFNVNGGGNYISDGELMVWLANQQDRIYGDLEQSMDLANQRAAVTNALTDIKLHLAEANRSGDFAKVDAELQAFMSEYGADPQFAELATTVGEIAGDVHQKWDDTVRGYNQALAQEAISAQTVGNGGNFGGRGGTGSGPLPSTSAPVGPIKMPAYADDVIKSWTTALDEKLDVSAKNDQLTMIHIQELKATLDQSTQLGSTLISSSDQTLDAVISNIA